MTPRVELKAKELLKADLFFNKYALAQIAHCDQRTAQRTLCKLHKAKIVVIKEWFRHYKHWIPVYILRKAKRADAIKPEPMTRSEISKRYNDDVEHKIDRLMRTRAKRTIKKMGI